MKQISSEERNRIRCSVALSVPLVLNYIMNPTVEKFEEVRHMMPTYELANAPVKISPYFTPWDTNDKGKFRIYVNSNGFRIRFMTFQSVKRFRENIKEFLDQHGYPDTSDTAIKKEIAAFAGKWVIMQGDMSSKKTWEDLIKSIVAYEKISNMDNHPPLGDDVWHTNYDFELDGMKIIPESAHIFLTKYMCHAH